MRQKRERLTLSGRVRRRPEFFKIRLSLNDPGPFWGCGRGRRISQIVPIKPADEGKGIWDFGGTREVAMRIWVDFGSSAPMVVGHPRRRPGITTDEQDVDEDDGEADDGGGRGVTKARAF